MTVQPDDVDALAAALRADATDLDIYARVLTESLAEALPADMVTVDRERTMGDRVAGRPGRVRSISLVVRDHELTLAVGSHGGPTAKVRQRVRGVVISSRDVSVDEWARILAESLAERARESQTARAALGRLLGQA